MTTFSTHAMKDGGPMGEVRLDATVEHRLRAVGARLRRFLLLEGTGQVALFVLAAVTAMFLIDYGARGVRLSMRAALLALFLLGVGWSLYRRIIAPMRVPCGLPEVANLVERKYPHLGSSLISAVRFSSTDSGRDYSRQLMGAVVEGASQRALDVDFHAVLDSRRARRGLVMLVGVVLSLTAWFVVTPASAKLWFERCILLSETPWPKQSHLIVQAVGTEIVGARGDDIVIEVKSEGVAPSEVDIVFATAGGKRGRDTMITVGRGEAVRYRHTFKNAQEEYVFHVEGGDDSTDEFRIRLVDRPAIEATEMRITPPAYVGLPPLTISDGQRSAQVLPGSEVTIRARVNKSLAEAVMIGADGESVTSSPIDEEHHEFTVGPKRSQSYRFQLKDSFGFENRQDVTIAFRMLKDEPPTVHLKLPGVGDMITPEAVLPVEVESSDTYGLASTQIEYVLSRDDGAVKTIPLADFVSGSKSYVERLDWAVGDAGPLPGETLTLSTTATDFDNVSGPNIGESPELRLRVVTRDELLAELQRREQEHRADFERLLDSQEQLRGLILTEFRKLENEGVPAEWAGLITPLERRQRNIGASVNVVRQQFERILAERRINRLDTPEEEARLNDGIVVPLSNLVRRELPAAADTLRQWSQGGSVELGRRIDTQQAELLNQMRAVLANMLQWEGYQEVVSMLRDILRLQRELEKETRDAAENQADEVFGD